MSEFENPEIYRAIMESLQTGVYFVDRDQRILFWNDGAEKITGYHRHEVVGGFCRDTLLAKNAGDKNVLADAADTIVSVLRDGRPTIAEVSLRHKDGYRIYVRLRGVAIRNSHGTIIGAAESFDESLSASEWDRRQNKLAGYGFLDAVTGVLNEDYTLSHLRESIATFAQHPLPFSIICIELDAIDRLRSTYGQAIVPPALRVVAQTIENSLRPTDLLGRLGENRFLAILAECGASEVEKTAERLRKTVSMSGVEWWGDTHAVTASFGGTTIRAGDTMESLLSRAEKAISQSVASNGNSVSLVQE
jgi:diguanylate cyclase (GGDEF)-like protein/PAS domain S-box-containing protein